MSYYPEPIKQFEIIRNDRGYALAIAVEGWFLINLKCGTIRNEMNIEKLLAILNAAVASVNNPAWAGICSEDVALEMALRNIMPMEIKEKEND